MIKFKEYSEVKEMYDKGKHFIWYKKGKTKYKVSHLGSTIFCKDTKKGYGMGAITNFPIEGFYAEPKPEPVIEETIETENKDMDKKFDYNQEEFCDSYYESAFGKEHNNYDEEEGEWT